MATSSFRIKVKFLYSPAQSTTHLLLSLTLIPMTSSLTLPQPHWNVPQTLQLGSFLRVFALVVPSTYHAFPRQLPGSFPHFFRSQLRCHLLQAAFPGHPTAPPLPRSLPYCSPSDVPYIFLLYTVLVMYLFALGSRTVSDT